MVLCSLCSSGFGSLYGGVSKWERGFYSSFSPFSIFISSLYFPVTSILASVLLATSLLLNCPPCRPRRYSKRRLNAPSCLYKSNPRIPLIDLHTKQHHQHQHCLFIVFFQLFSLPTPTTISIPICYTRACGCSTNPPDLKLPVVDHNDL